MLRAVTVAAAGFLALKAPSSAKLYCKPYVHDEDFERWLKACRRNSVILKKQLTEINYNECLLVHKALESNKSSEIPQIAKAAELAREKSQNDFESRMLSETGDFGDHLATIIDSTMNHIFRDPLKFAKQILVLSRAGTNPSLDTLYTAAQVLIDSNVPEADHRQKLMDAAKVIIWEGYDPKGCEKFKEAIAKAAAKGKTRK
jgi:hypothetical protein